MGSKDTLGVIEALDTMTLRSREFEGEVLQSLRDLLMLKPLPYVCGKTRRQLRAATGQWQTHTRSRQTTRAGHEAHFLFVAAQEDLDQSLQNVEGISDVRVTVPRYFPRRVDRELSDPGPRMRRVVPSIL
jgi:hypothetical protein